jgi:hypothetical protein
VLAFFVRQRRPEVLRPSLDDQQRVAKGVAQHAVEEGDMVGAALERTSALSELCLTLDAIQCHLGRLREDRREPLVARVESVGIGRAGRENATVAKREKGKLCEWAADVVVERDPDALVRLVGPVCGEAVLGADDEFVRLEEVRGVFRHRRRLEGVVFVGQEDADGLTIKRSLRVIDGDLRDLIVGARTEVPTRRRLDGLETILPELLAGHVP